MTIIRVDPDKLRWGAREIEKVAGDVDAAASELHTAILFEPIDARYAPELRAKLRTYDAQFVAQTSPISNGLGEQSTWLVDLALRFEEADRASLQGMDRLWAATLALIADYGESTLVPLWILDGTCPPGMDPRLWNRLPLEDRHAIRDAGREAFSRWFRGKVEDGTIDWATLEEFEDLMRGERKVWTWSENGLNIRGGPGTENPVVGLIPMSGVAYWTGQVQLVDGKEWYEVRYQDPRHPERGEIRGWVSAKYLAEYAYVDPDRVGPDLIDLSVPDEVVRQPQDPWLADGAETYGVPQYMPIRPPILDASGNIVDRGQPRVHWNLCGQAATAATLRVDIKPLLESWVADEDTRAAATRILNDPNEGTLRSELTAIFELYGRETTNHDGFISPVQFQEELRSGRRFIAGVGLDTSTGEIGPGEAGHWIVVEEVIPVGNSGYVRIFQSHVRHPNFNRLTDPVILEQVIPWEQFQEAWRDFGPNSATFHGFWIEPEVQPPSSETLPGPSPS